LENAKTKLQTGIAALQTQADGSGAKLQRVSSDNDGRDIYIEGANLHVRSGLPNSEANSATVTGYGNVILGYNESAPTYQVYDPTGTGPELGGGSVKTGSHNLIVGSGHSYTSYGGVVSGVKNRITRPGAAALAGVENLARASNGAAAAGMTNL